MKIAQVQSEAKEKLLEAARKIMLVKGFPATSIEEICEEANVTKGCFFHYFDSKEELGKELIERFLSCAGEMSKDAPFRLEADPLKRVYGYIDYMAAKSEDACRQTGCLLGTFAQELSNTYPQIRAACENAFKGWVTAFKNDLDLAKAEYAPKSHVDTKSLAEHFIATFEGSLIMAKARKDRSVIKNNLLHFKNYIKSLFGR